MNRYENLKTNVNSKGEKYTSTVFYPTVSEQEDDIYVVTVEGDSLHNLAYEYYEDSSLWWVIGAINRKVVRSTRYLPAGVQLRIPKNVSEYITEFIKLNS